MNHIKIQENIVVTYYEAIGVGFSIILDFLIDFDFWVFNACLYVFFKKSLLGPSVALKGHGKGLYG